MTDTSIIYLQNDKFDFYSSLGGKLIEFRFVPEIVRDLDVINPELLENLIKLFIANNKIVPGNLIIVLSDSASFIKDFLLSDSAPQLPKTDITQGISVVSTPRITPEVIDEQIKHFIEHVPFDDVASQTYPLTNGTKVWATNKELYATIANSFDKAGFEIRAVLPGLEFIGNISSKSVLDPVMANIILQQVDSLRQRSLLTKATAELPEKVNMSKTDVKKTEMSAVNVEISDEPKKEKNGKRLFLMIGIFVILIIILIVVYLGSLRQS